MRNNQPKKRTRGNVTEALFGQVKLLQKHGLSAAKTARVMELSSSTTSRIFGVENYAKYKEFVRRISQRLETVPEIVPLPVSGTDEQIAELDKKIHENDTSPGIEEYIEVNIEDLTKAVNRLAAAVEDSNNRRRIF
jgi:DNA-binding transcriptional MerR regulator